ncbi:MAG: FAD-dependent oxidoreductase [Bacteriovoracaceae bacterium]
MNPKTLIIIGNGIASWRVNAELEKKFVDTKIIRIGTDEFAPGCSFRSTAVNCLRGTKKNISRLGDLIVDSHLEFESFYQENAPHGVDKTYEWQLWDQNGENRDKWEKRYGPGGEIDEVDGIKLSHKFQGCQSPAYLINPELFYRWQVQQFQNTEYLNEFVTEVNRKDSGFLVKTHNGLEVFGEKLFICGGYLSHNFMDLVEDGLAKDYLQRCKPVRGSFMSSKAAWPGKGLSLAVGSSHLIFRESDQTLMIGSTSENNSALQVPMQNELEMIYQKILGALKDPRILPPREMWTIVNGVRHKGVKREPFWGELSPNCHGVFGLYKNAFSFSFLAAKKLVEALS